MTLDPLDHWIQKKDLYLVLFPVAFSILCTPATTAPLERVFSASETFFKFFHYWFLLFLYGIYNFISDSMLYLYLQCTLRYSLDSTIVDNKCSFLVQRRSINLQHTVLNCIHAYHVSNNLNGVKPQSHGCHNHEIHQQKMSPFFF